MFTIILLALVATCLNAENILFLNSGVIAQSHVFFTGKIADVLVDAGHNVTYYQQIGFTDLTKVGSKKAHIIVRPCDHAYCRGQPSENVWASGDEMLDNLEIFSAFGKIMAHTCESQMKDTNLTDMFKAVKFELVVAEHFDYCAHALAEKAGIKRVITASAIMIEPHILNLMGNPTNLAFTPGYDDDHGSQLTYLQRVKALFMYPVKEYFMHRSFYKYVEDAVKKHYRPDFDAAEAIGKSSYVFVNVDEHLAFQQPLSEKFVYVGGVGEHIGRDHVLPESFNKIMNDSRNGVILISFGTIAQSYLLPEETKQELVAVFKTFPEYDFIWKYEVDDDIAANLSNVHKVKWTPQSDLLAHPKLLAFVTHGGLNSMSETAHKGKPFVCIPLFGDQNHNCFAAQEKGLSEMVEKSEMTKDSLVHALKTVLQPSYRERALEFAKMMADKPFQPKDRIVGFVNHALKYDLSAALDLPGRRMTTIQYYFIDVIVPVVIFVVTILYYLFRVSKDVVVYLQRFDKAKVE